VVRSTIYINYGPNYNPLYHAPHTLPRAPHSTTRSTRSTLHSTTLSARRLPTTNKMAYFSLFGDTEYPLEGDIVMPKNNSIFYKFLEAAKMSPFLIAAHVNHSTNRITHLSHPDLKEDINIIERVCNALRDKLTSRLNEQLFDSKSEPDYKKFCHAFALFGRSKEHGVPAVEFELHVRRPVEELVNHEYLFDFDSPLTPRAQPSTELVEKKRDLEKKLLELKMDRKIATGRARHKAQILTQHAPTKKRKRAKKC